MRDRINSLMRKIRNLNTDHIEESRWMERNTDIKIRVNLHNNYPERDAVFAKFILFNHVCEIMYGIFGEEEPSRIGKPVVMLDVSHCIAGGDSLSRGALHVMAVDGEINRLESIFDTNTVLFLENTIKTIEKVVDELIAEKENE